MDKINDAISWEESRKITEELKKQAAVPNDVLLAQLACSDGVAAVFYGGNELEPGLWNKDDTRMIFVCPAGEDAIRHFAKGDTGYSTLRRSLAALLFKKYNLEPVPRSDNFADNDRYDNYALTEESEKNLTDWIYENCLLSFLPADGTPNDVIIQGLINYNVPILNLQGNPENKFGAEIKRWRKKCAAIAKKSGEAKACAAGEI